MKMREYNCPCPDLNVFVCDICWECLLWSWCLLWRDGMWTGRNTPTFQRNPLSLTSCQLDCVWNVMTHAQKPDFVFRRNGRVHLNRQGRQFSRLLAAEVCSSAVVMLDTPSFEVVWRVLATHSIRQFPLHFPSRAAPCAITFQLDCTLDQRDRSCHWYVAGLTL